MDYVISLFIIFVNILVSRWTSKKILFPATLFSIIWFVVILIHFICSEYSYLELFPLSWNSLIIFTLGSCCFTFGSIISSALFKRKNNNIYHFFCSSNFQRFITAMALILFPLYAYESYLIAVNNPISGNWFLDLRLNINSGEGERQFGHGIIFANFAFFIHIYRFYSGQSTNKRAGVLTAILLLMYVVLSTGRTSVMQFLLMILGIISIYRRIRIKNILYVLGGFIFLFFVYGIVLNKGASEGNTLRENIESLSANFVMYCVGPLSAFDYAINHDIHFYGGERTFRVFILLLNKLGMIQTEPAPLIERYVFVPFPTNVYTCYYIYIQDFGVWYSMFVILIQSFLHTMFFYKATQNGRYQFQFSFLYCMFLFPLIMSFFHDQFILLIPNWIYIIILVVFSKKFIFYNKVAL